MFKMSDSYDKNSTLLLPYDVIRYTYCHRNNKKVTKTPTYKYRRNFIDE